MLTNITKENQTVVYNGKSRELKPGESIDIRDFDIENKHVAGAEKHIMAKRPGLFQQSVTIGNSKAESELTAQIKALTDKNDALIKELAQIRASEKLAQEKHAASAGEIETMKQEVNSMKAEVNKYKATHDDLQDEVEKLRAASRKVK